MKPKPRVPWVTLGLIAACLAVSFGVAFSPDLIEQWGFRASQPKAATAVASLFLHANLLHLLGNMLALAAIGTWVEEALGSARFLILYLVGGLAGCALHWAVLRQAPTSPPLVGASGAVACCVAYGSVRYMWSRVSFGPKLKLPVVGVAGVWLALQLVGAFVQIGQAVGGVSFWSHLGGVAAGLGFAAIFGAAKDASLHRGRKTIAAMDQRSAGAQLTAAKAHLRHHPDDRIAWRQMAEAAQLLGHREEEIGARMRLIDLDADGNVAEELVRLTEMNALSEITSVRRCRLAEQVLEDDPEVARQLLRSVASGPKTDPQRPEALYRLAEVDPERGPEYLDSLRKDHPLEPATARAESKGMIP